MPLGYIGLSFRNAVRSCENSRPANPSVSHVVTIENETVGKEYVTMDLPYVPDPGTHKWHPDGNSTTDLKHFCQPASLPIRSFSVMALSFALYLAWKLEWTPP